MSQESNEPLKKLGGLNFVDQIVDGLRKIGESVQLQGLIDDAFYMTSKYALQFLLGTIAKLKIEGKADFTANRGAILATLASSPADILLMTQIASKKMSFVVNKEQSEAPVMKSVLKGLGVITDLDGMISGESDAAIYQWVRSDRKILCIVVDETTDVEKIENSFKKALKLARDGFCPIIPIGITGAKDIKPNAEILIKIGERIGVNQNVKDADLVDMAKDLIEKLKFLKTSIPSS